MQCVRPLAGHPVVGAHLHLHVIIILLSVAVDLHVLRQVGQVALAGANVPLKEHRAHGRFVSVVHQGVVFQHKVLEDVTHPELQLELLEARQLIVRPPLMMPWVCPTNAECPPGSRYL